MSRTRTSSQPSRHLLAALMVCAATVGGMTGATSKAAAAAGPRLTTVFSEHIGGERAPVSAAELALTSALAVSGVRFIDEAQSRKIRSVTDAGALISGGVSPVITSLDADFILAAVVRVEAFQSDLLKGSAYRYRALVDARLIAVDTGAVVGAFQPTGSALGYTPAQAQRGAARAAGEKLADAVSKALAVGGPPATIELTVVGLPDATATLGLVARLERIDGIDRLTVARAGQGKTKIALEGGKMVAAGAQEMALSLDSVPGLGLQITGFSRTAIQGRWNPQGAARLDIWVTPLTGRLPRSSGTSPSLLAEIVGSGFASEPFVVLARQAGRSF